MSSCPHCGQAHPGLQFCPHTGHALPSCPHCGQSHDNATFCPNTGLALAAPPTTQTPTPPPATAAVAAGAAATAGPSPTDDSSPATASNRHGAVPNDPPATARRRLPLAAALAVLLVLAGLGTWRAAAGRSTEQPASAAASSPTSNSPTSNSPTSNSPTSSSPTSNSPTDPTTTSATTSAASPTPATVQTPVGNGPLAQTSWTSIRHPIDCTQTGVGGVDVASVTYADITDDGIPEAFVVLACQSRTSAWPNQLEVYDGASAPKAPKLLGVLMPAAAAVAAGTRRQITTVGTVGPTVVIGVQTWSSRASSCCPDGTATQKALWDHGTFVPAP